MNGENKRKIIKAFIAALTVVVVLLVFFSPKLATVNQTKVSYQTFLAQVSNHEIEEVEIDEVTEKITYELADGKTYYTNYPDYESFKQQLLVSGVEIKIDESAAFAEMIPYLSLVIYLLLIAVLIKMINPGGMFRVENSKNIKTRFSDVAGMDEVKEDLLLLSDMMKSPVYRKTGARLPKGILLEGAPGNGKTLIARAFAGETGVNFIAVNASEFSSSLVGAGSSKVRKLFRKAKSIKPCVIFIDEIDGVGSSRSSDNSAAGREMNTIITALLNEMDGFKTSDGIMVIAATNRPQALDEALIRPGRFDRRLVIPYPDKETRIKLLKLYTAKTEVDGEVNFASLANRLYGCSGSEIECVVNEAVINSVRNKRSAVNADDFEQAIIQMTVKGSVKEHSNQNEKERLLAAYHEAGHAVTAHFLSGTEVASVSIKPTTSGAGGFTVTENSDETNYTTVEDIVNKIMVCYGGRASEFLLGGKSLSKISSGAQEDVKEATKLAVSCVNLKDGIDYSLFAHKGEKEIMKASKEILDTCWKNTVKLAEEKWEYIEKTASILVEKETLTKEEFAKIFE